ncbi:ester cyclase [Bradyrhizobium sp. STM 3557]|uniref:ester cyclase n=1 Tax=Bradyrhizobium sp. STM 3557 TaxID=578920 RepID=UPI00388FE151
MKRVLALYMLVTTAALSPARAEMTVEAARSTVAPFYKALNAAFAPQSADLIRQATAPDWTSCRENDVCSGRDEVIAGVAARLKSVPDLTWQIKDVAVAGNQVTVRGEATGKPAGPFMGAAYSGKSFKVMSIDIHTIENGRMVRSYHVEDWIGAVRQLSTE